jgi:hypothetical protein
MECIGAIIDWLAQHAPIVTAFVASFALYVAWTSIGAQKETARKRAAIDFFLKTEMDSTMLGLHQAYKAGRDAFKEQGRTPSEFETQSKTSYDAIRSYLNVHELMAVGVNRSVFDNDVCYEFWGDELLKAYRAVEPLITEIRQKPDGLESYAQLVVLYKDWHTRAEEGRKKQLTSTR